MTGGLMHLWNCWLELWDVIYCLGTEFGLNSRVHKIKANTLSWDSQKKAVQRWPNLFFTLEKPNRSMLPSVKVEGCLFCC